MNDPLTPSTLLYLARRIFADGPYSVVPPKVTLKLPSAGPDESRGESSKRGAEVDEKPSKRARYNMSNLPDEYEVPKHADHARTTNTYIFTEKVKKWGATGSGSGGPSRHRREKGGLPGMALITRGSHADRHHKLNQNCWLKWPMSSPCSLFRTRIISGFYVKDS